MAMTRKDYVNLATAMGLELRYAAGATTEFEKGKKGGLREMVFVVAEALNSANANFDRDRFTEFTLEVANGTRDAQGRKVKGKAA